MPPVRFCAGGRSAMIVPTATTKCDYPHHKRDAKKLGLHYFNPLFETTSNQIKSQLSTAIRAVKNCRRNFPGHLLGR